MVVGNGNGELGWWLKTRIPHLGLVSPLPRHLLPGMAMCMDIYFLIRKQHSTKITDVAGVKPQTRITIIQVCSGSNLFFLFSAAVFNFRISTTLNYFFVFFESAASSFLCLLIAWASFTVQFVKFLATCSTASL